MSQIQSKARSPVIAVVGPCASGKSTLAANLLSLGIDARVSGQEHSEIASLWKRLEADVVVALHIDLETLRTRRGQSWSQALFERQLGRLREAYAAADIHIDTSESSESQALSIVTCALYQRNGSLRNQLAAKRSPG